jgi:hypothetical protein
MSIDDDLAAWTAAVRLPDGDAAAIFQRIVAAPVGLSVAPPAAVPQLSPSWWRRYNAGFAARMVASTAPVRLAA